MQSSPLSRQVNIDRDRPPRLGSACLVRMCGKGAFYDAFPAHLDKDWCELGVGRDFFGHRRRVNWIISNPPYSKFRGFLMHGMDLADHLVYGNLTFRILPPEHAARYRTGRPWLSSDPDTAPATG